MCEVSDPREEGLKSPNKRTNGKKLDLTLGRELEREVAMASCFSFNRSTVLHLKEGGEERRRRREGKGKGRENEREGKGRKRRGREKRGGKEQ